jgi:2-polyprenyl-3-methyl-5-hydroxy-6-metoxy-1,4-benzoquinol methylase
MMDLSSRAELDEVMDDPALDVAVYRRCLADLAAVNRVTFTHGATLRWLDEATRELLPGARFSVLDVAYGQGDLLRAIWHWAGKRGFRVALSGIDLNPRSREAARAAGDFGIDYQTGDVFAYMPKAPDFIVTSQFTHHLADAQIIELLRWMEANAVRGWHIADLHRSAFAYYGFPLLARLMGWHEIVRKDGAASIARSFRRADWERLLASAGIPARISWRLGFRYSVSQLK